MKITIGTFRPLWEDFYNSYYGSEEWAEGKCSCGLCLAQDKPTIREHWQLGHFDEVVYKDVD